MKKKKSESKLDLIEKSEFSSQEFEKSNEFESDKISSSKKNIKTHKKKFKRRRKSRDLSTQILSDSRHLGILKKILVNKIIITFFLIVIQIALWIVFLFWLEPYLKYYIGSGLVLVSGFMIYLSNCKGKNEFKLAWLAPTVIFPLFGISGYFLYHANWGGHELRTNLNRVKSNTNSLLPEKESANSILQKFPEVQDLAKYLLNEGNFFPHTNNVEKYYPNGESLYPDFLENLKSAKEFIFIEFFIVDIDESFIKILNILKQKVKEGVEVRFLYDAFGSYIPATKTYKKYLESFGIKAQVFLPLVPVFSTQLNNRDHRKIVVIDGKIGYTGGLNLKNEYFNINNKKNKFPYWKDNFIEIRGSAIRNLTEMFLQNWNIQIKPQKSRFSKKINENFIEDDYKEYICRNYEIFSESQGEGLVIPYGDDAHNKNDIAEDVYLYILNKAQKYVYITSPYVVIDNQMLETLTFAAKRGVDVKLIVPSEPDHILTFAIGKTYIKNLLDNGIHVYLYNKGFIHAKTFVSDDVTATVGSVNLDYRSFFHHFECGVFLHKTKCVSDIKNDIQETLKDCTEMFLEDYKKLPLKIRFSGRLFRLFAPLV